MRYPVYSEDGPANATSIINVHIEHAREHLRQVVQVEGDELDALLEDAVVEVLRARSKKEPAE